MTKLAFASCSRYDAFPNIPHHLKQPEWKKIQELEPDYLLLLGDQIYMDYGVPLLNNPEPLGWPEKVDESVFTAKMREKYIQQCSIPHFKNLIDEMRDKNALFATWDDHDFAWDNAKGDVVPEDKKSSSIMLFKEYILGEQTPDNSPIYRYIDLPENNPVARFIILDNRSYSDTIKFNYDLIECELESASEGKSLLGSEQMQFLTEKMQHDLPHTFICSGTTLTQGNENWSQYEEEYEVFCQLVKDATSNVFYVGGDIHKNMLKKPNYLRPCFEIISSGISNQILGLPTQIDDCHNWAILDFDINFVNVSFYKAKLNSSGDIMQVKEKIKTLL